MKKLVLTTICALTVSGAAFAQSDLINWATPSSSITVQTNTSISPLFGGTGNGGVVGNTFGAATGVAYDYVLLYSAQSIPGQTVASTDTSVWDGAWNSTGLTATNATFAHNVGPVSPGTSAVTALASTNNIILVGWSADLGALGSGQNTWGNVSNILANWTSTYQAIAAESGLSYYFGESAFGYLIGNTSPAPGASVFAGAADANGLPINSPNMQLYALPVPEPTTIALAGLGGLSLLLFRRRKV